MSQTVVEAENKNYKTRLHLAIENGRIEWGIKKHNVIASRFYSSIVFQDCKYPTGVQC